MRILVTVGTVTLLDLCILEPADEHAPGDREAWPVDSQTIATDARIGFVDDVGAGSTFPWE